MNTTKTIAMEANVTSANAIKLMAQADAYWQLGAAALVPEFNSDAQALRARVICELSQQPRYAGQWEISAKGKTLGQTKPQRNSAAERMVSRILSAVRTAAKGDEGASDRAEPEEIEIPEELLAAAAKLAKLAQQYEGARKLATRALATAFAK